MAGCGGVTRKATGFRIPGKSDAASCRFSGFDHETFGQARTWEHNQKAQTSQTAGVFSHATGNGSYVAAMESDDGAGRGQFAVL
jgi:hypothetical protein